MAARQKSTPRAPAGSVKVGQRVSSLVSKYGLKNTAKVLGRSQASVRKVASAYKAGRMGKAIPGQKSLAGWQGQIKTARPKVSKLVERGQTAKAQTRTIETAARAKAEKIRDKQIAAELDISYQKATALRLAGKRGTATEAGSKDLAAAVDRIAEDKPHPIDGVWYFPNPEHLPESSQVRPRGLFAFKEDAIDYIKTISPGARAYFVFAKVIKQDKQGHEQEFYQVYHVTEESDQNYEALALEV